MIVKTSAITKNTGKATYKNIQTATIPNIAITVPAKSNATIYI